MILTQSMKALRAILLASLCAVLCIASLAKAEGDTFDFEPPTIKNLLTKASALAEKGSLETSWQAAGMYCEAARYGSAEAVYRLGMLYAFGQGVPASRDYAANLFGIAARNGHFEAQSMLETIAITTQNTPPCITDNVLPEKAPAPVVVVTQSPAIDLYIARLPKNKLWLVEMVETIATWHKIDPKLVLSIITAESNFKVNAKSNADAHGLMQLIPATSERFNVKNVYNASQNIKGGVKYLRWLLSYFRGDVKLAVAAYNAGERAVDRYHGVPPYAETKNYVKKVMDLYQQERHDFDATITRASPALRVKKKVRG